MTRRKSSIGDSLVQYADQVHSEGTSQFREALKEVNTVFVASSSPRNTPHGGLHAVQHCRGIHSSCITMIARA